MSPRAYRAERRQAMVEETRRRILSAARELLAGEEERAEFSIDSLAKRAGVARMTVYYQFGSKRGLLEAIFDSLAAGGLIRDLPAAYSRPDPVDSLNAVIRAFTRFWASERTAIRRIRSLATLDPEVEASLTERDERRRGGLGLIVEQLSEQKRRSDAAPLDETADILHALTSFETYDALARRGRSTRDVERIIRRLVAATLSAQGLSG